MVDGFITFFGRAYILLVCLCCPCLANSWGICFLKGWEAFCLLPLQRRLVIIGMVQRLQ